MAEPAHLLVVDDDQRIRELLQTYLQQAGFAVSVADAAPAMDAALTRGGIDLMVLDLMLPGEDGLSICRRLRGQGVNTPIVMLTARGDDIDRIVGLEMGADDYLPKPFNPRELLARIQAVLRRRQPAAASTPSADALVLSFGPFVLNTQQRTLRKNGELIELTSGELAMLRALAQHPNQPLSRDRIAQLTRGRDADATDRSLDVQISRLRKLIEPDPARPQFIQTVWGVGYVLVTSPPTA